LSDRQLDYLLREFEHLKNEIEAEVSESRTLERYAVIGTGATWAWLATHPIPAGSRAVWWIPTIFVAAGAVRALAMAQFIVHAARRLREVERIVLGEMEGWEAYVARVGRGAMPWTAVATWFGLLLVSALGPLLLKQ
jgi:hypothetical protein